MLCLLINYRSIKAQAATSPKIKCKLVDTREIESSILLIDLIILPFNIRTFKVDLTLLEDTLRIDYVRRKRNGRLNIPFRFITHIFIRNHGFSLNLDSSFDKKFLFNHNDIAFNDVKFDNLNMQRFVRQFENSLKPYGTEITTDFKTDLNLVQNNLEIRALNNAGADKVKIALTNIAQVAIYKEKFRISLRGEFQRTFRYHYTIFNNQNEIVSQADFIEHLENRVRAKDYKIQIERDLRKGQFIRTLRGVGSITLVVGLVVWPYFLL